ncbi:hypothetical protein M9458_053906 [Cirrhinus mrigala]|uniref:Uncharacterized protein n=1 Tax=Cirrhinus mrigala TaxID=683832 RepID=A0ABD0MKY2_CIRMR
MPRSSTCRAINRDHPYPTKIFCNHKWGPNSANLGAKLADPAITSVRSAPKSAARPLKPAAITVPILSPKPMTTKLSQQAAASKSSQSTTLHSNMLVVPHMEAPITPHPSLLTSTSSRSSSSPLAYIMATLHVDTPSHQARVPGQSGRPARIPDQDGHQTRVPGQNGRHVRIPDRDGLQARAPGQDGRSARAPGQDGRPVRAPSQDGRPTRAPRQDGRPVRAPSP